MDLPKHVEEGVKALPKDIKKILESNESRDYSAKAKSDLTTVLVNAAKEDLSSEELSEYLRGLSLTDEEILSQISQEYIARKEMFRKQLSLAGSVRPRLIGVHWQLIHQISSNMVVNKKDTSLPYFWISLKLYDPVKNEETEFPFICDSIEMNIFLSEIQEALRLMKSLTQNQSDVATK